MTSKNRIPDAISLDENSEDHIATKRRDFVFGSAVAASASVAMATSEPADAFGARPHWAGRYVDTKQIGCRRIIREEPDGMTLSVYGEDGYPYCAGPYDLKT